MLCSTDSLEWVSEPYIYTCNAYIYVAYLHVHECMHTLMYTCIIYIVYNACINVYVH